MTFREYISKEAAKIKLWPAWKRRYVEENFLDEDGKRALDLAYYREKGVWPKRPLSGQQDPFDHTIRVTITVPGDYDIVVTPQNQVRAIRRVR